MPSQLIFILITFTTYFECSLILTTLQCTVLYCTVRQPWENVRSSWGDEKDPKGQGKSGTYFVLFTMLSFDFWLSSLSFTAVLSLLCFLKFTLLYSSLLYSTPLYSTLLYSTLFVSLFLLKPHYTTLNYSTLHYSTHFHSIPGHSSTPRRASLPGEGFIRNGGKGCPYHTLGLSVSRSHSLSLTKWLTLFVSHWVIYSLLTHTYSLSLSVIPL